MASVPDATALCDLSIPGTHDSMAFHCPHPESVPLPDLPGAILIIDAVANVIQSVKSLWVICQSFALDEQLRIGIRCFDFRVYWHPQRQQFEFAHGPVALDTTLDDALA